MNPEMIILMLTFDDILPKFQTAQTIMQTNQLVFTQIKPLREDLKVLISQYLTKTCHKQCECDEPCKLGEFADHFQWAREKATELDFIEDSLYENFNADEYWETTMKPLLENMRDEIDAALTFDPILEGFVYLDPQNYTDGIDLDTFGETAFRKTVQFYATEQTEKKTGLIPSVSKPKIADEENAMAEFKTAKKLIKNFKDNYEIEKEIDLKSKSDKITNLEKCIPHATKLKKREHEKQVKRLKRELVALEKRPYSFQDMLKDWFKSLRAKRLSDMCFLVEMAALVPMSTAIVEASWSVMNLHCTDHSGQIEVPHLSSLMHCSLNKEPVDYHQVKDTWANARKRRVKVHSNQPQGVVDLSKENNEESEQAPVAEMEEDHSDSDDSDFHGFE